MCAVPLTCSPNTGAAASCVTPATAAPNGPAAAGATGFGLPSTLAAGRACSPSNSLLLLLPPPGDCCCMGGLPALPSAAAGEPKAGRAAEPNGASCCCWLAVPAEPIGVRPRCCPAPDVLLPPPEAPAVRSEPPAKHSRTKQGESVSHVRAGALLQGQVQLSGGGGSPAAA